MAQFISLSADIQTGEDLLSAHWAGGSSLLL
jgi:hypothetical protein